MRMFCSVHIDAPQEAIFRVASDFPNAPSVVSAIERVEMLSPATDGSPVGVGTRFKETRIMFGKQATETMDVTEFDPPRAYTLTAESHGMRYASRVTVLEEQPGRVGGGCRLSFDFTGTPLSLGAKAMSPIFGLMMKGAMRKAMDKDLAEIKHHAERRSDAPGHSEDADASDDD